MRNEYIWAVTDAAELLKRVRGYVSHHIKDVVGAKPRAQREIELSCHKLTDGTPVGFCVAMYQPEPTGRKPWRKQELLVIFHPTVLTPEKLPSTTQTVMDALRKAFQKRQDGQHFAIVFRE